MRKDNPSFRPCARYGMNCVGPGWESSLVELDQRFVEILGYEGHLKLKVLQIKEKFGGLRVYIDASTFDTSTRKLLYAAITEAEESCSQRCEACGSISGVETRVRAKVRMGRTLTLCEEHHNIRDRKGVLQFGSHKV